MKTPLLGLRTAIYKVSDITKAKEWYSKALQIEPYFDQPDYVGFNVGEGVMVASLKDPWGNLLGLIYNPNFK